jgi:hypothetical protein
MPSRRTIDPAFWRSETVVALSIARRYFFIGILSNADDQGRLRAHPALLRAQIYPFDDISLDQIRDDLAELAGGGFITLYASDGRDYLQIPDWWKYQRQKWARPSKHPPPEGWIDRLCYRQGNAVIKKNWDGSEEPAASDPDGDELAEGPQPKEPEAVADPSPDHGVSSMEPLWDHGELAPGPAPSSRGRHRGRDRGNDRSRGRESGSNSRSGSDSSSTEGGPRPPPPSAAAGPNGISLRFMPFRRPMAPDNRV